MFPQCYSVYISGRSRVVSCDLCSVTNLKAVCWDSDLAQVQDLVALELLTHQKTYLETAQLIHFSHFRKWGAHSVCSCMQSHFLILYEFNWEKWLLGGLLWHLPKNDQWLLETICDGSPSGQSAQGSSCPAWGAGKDTRHSPGADVGRASSVKKKSSDVSCGWKPVIS